MTTPPDRSTEIASYLAAVERHLNDLPTHIRQDLMSELDAHLTEVAADLPPGNALRDLLGSPEAYARELRDTAEVDKEPVGARMRRRLADAAAPALARLKGAADRYAVSSGFTDAAELRDRLRPGWWVLRGALVAALFVYWLSAAQYGVTGYSIFGSIPGLLLIAGALLACVWASMRFGAKSAEWGARRRRWVAAGGLALVAFTGYQFMWLGFSVPVEYVETTTYYDDTPSVQDVRVYDEHGNLLTDVYLFDENGNPLWLGDPYSCPTAARDPFATESPYGDEYEEAVQSADENLGYQYPLCDPEGEPTMPAETAEADPTDGPTATAPDGESPTEEPATEAAESATPTPGESPTK
ncbi:HAAS signaling domain-containing protein [Glycomyces niveus]|uniref:Uncharacterized protein n=1 Tax=Glycomyces niveus TaxID=2820287 RepID=A0ABS3U491_9ACTN|nr:hypothetical protein [Glycomyces sp. NEAU-S30]MBO3733588.1 hypothetical protein [Glycomyces sp. NEAU-S30]